MLKTLWNLVALDWEVFVAAVGHLLDDTAFIMAQNFDCLLAVVHRADSSRVELALERCLFIFNDLVRQLDRLVVCSIDPVPDKGMDILAGASDLLVDFVDGLLGLDALLVRIMN